MVHALIVVLKMTMQWNAYLADAIAWLILVVPAALIALKLGFPKTRWWMILLAAAVLSWFVSVGYFWAFPPNMGFGAALARIFGWATMLPLVGLFSLIWLVKGLRGARGTQLVAAILVVTAFALPIVACFRWLPEEEARKIAQDELKRSGFTHFELRDTEKTWDGWTVYADVPNYPRYPVFLSRSGFCSGMGG